MAQPEVSWSVLSEDLKSFAVQRTPGEPITGELARRFAEAGVEVVLVAHETTTGQPMFRFSRRFEWFLHRRSRQ